MYIFIVSGEMMLNNWVYFTHQKMELYRIVKHLLVHNKCSAVHTVLEYMSRMGSNTSLVSK